jgi:dephospho-CoA kinase
MKTVLVLAGMPGSGKSIAGEFFKKKGFPVIRMSDPVRKEMEDLGLSITNTTLRDYVLEIRKKRGPNVVLDLLKGRMSEAFKHNDTIVLDGSRNISEVKELRKEKYRTILIGIITDKQLRFQRILNRAEKSDMKTLEEFEWRDEQELKFGMGDVLASADYYLTNNSSPSEFEKKLEVLTERIL